MKFKLLSESEYEAIYQQAFVGNLPQNADETAALEAEFELFDTRLRSALLKDWDENAFGDADFAISDEWSGSWHHCGGIYSERIICPRYLKILSDVMSSLPRSEYWTYHTSIEPQEGEFDLKWTGFFVRDGIAYHDEEFVSFGYLERFTQK